MTTDETTEAGQEAASGTETDEQTSTSTEAPPERRQDGSAPDNGSGDLTQLPPDRLAAMLKDKRSAEQSVRQRLRDVEADRDRLAGALGAYQQRSVQSAASEAGLLPEALPDLASMVDVEALSAEDGTVDDGKVKDALAELRKSRPHWFRPPPSTSGMQMTGGSGEAARGATWDQVIRG